MKKENISEIRRSLEPSAEMKRRVMERAAKLEAGRKTFGNEKTTTDSSTIAAFGTKEKKEQNTMSVNRSEIIKVKSHLPAAVISVAACAAVVIGIAAVNMNDKNPKPLPTTSQDSMTTNDQTVTKDEELSHEDEDLSPEDVMTVTESDGSTFTITDKDRIAAIDAIVEKTKKCHIWYGEAVPTERTLEYYVDGKQRIVEISGEQLSTYHPDSEPHPEICWVVTVDGESYALCEFTPDEPYYQLYYSTQKGGNLTFRKQNNKNNDSNNEDEFYDDPFDEEYHNEEAARKLKSIIDDIRKNSTPQYETENLYYYYEEHLPSGDDCRADCSFKLDGNYYDIELYWDSDLIRLDVCEWRDGKDLTLL
ncbi:MAG: hypothetical protein J5582_13935, partial [Ruminococcus sp.]|uniref:hypothetical protein n=1 Tax=Ruminococcus sp. TaxID=41978 RepID=UPI0025F8FFA1